MFALRDRPALHLTLTWFTLLLVGLVMSVSASSIVAQERFGDRLFFFKRQLFFAILGLLVAALFTHLPYRIWLFPRTIQWTMLTTTLLLVLVLFLPPIRSVHRWIRLGPLSFQPSELAKLALVLYIAFQVHRNGLKDFRHWSQGIMPVTTVSFLWVGLIAVEWDLGNALVLTLIALGLLYLAGTSWKYFLALGLVVLVLAAGVIRAGLYPRHWRDRIDAWLHPESYQQTYNYHRIQALIALGHGGWTGVGYGKSLQKLFYLPEPQGDYVLAILGEEWGLVGTLSLVLAYLWLFLAGWRIAQRCDDLGGRYLALGLSLWIGIQAFINISVVTGILPAKGLVLPFLSQGGTAMVLHCAAMGLLLSVDRFRHAPLAGMGGLDEASEQGGWRWS